MHIASIRLRPPRRHGSSLPLATHAKCSTHRMRAKLQCNQCLERPPLSAHTKVFDILALCEQSAKVPALSSDARRGRRLAMRGGEGDPRPWRGIDDEGRPARARMDGWPLSTCFGAPPSTSPAKQRRFSQLRVARRRGREGMSYGLLATEWASDRRCEMGRPGYEFPHLNRHPPLLPLRPPSNSNKLLCSRIFPRLPSTLLSFILLPLVLWDLRRGAPRASAAKRADHHR